MTIKAIRRELKTLQDVEFSGGVSDQAITEAQTALGLTFPRDYVAFLREFGSGGVSSEEFIGLGGLQHLDVVWLTQQLRNKAAGSRFARTLIPLRTDGGGNYDCIDTSKPTEHGEFQIVEWRHDAGDNQECQVLDTSFFGWMLAMLREIHRLDSETED